MWSPQESPQEERIEEQQEATKFAPNCQTTQPGDTSNGNSVVNEKEATHPLAVAIDDDVPVPSLKNTFMLASLERAQRFLGIEGEHLERIPNLKEKQRYVEYKYLFSELQYFTACKTYGFNDEHTIRVLASLDTLYTTLLEWGSSSQQSLMKEREHSFGLIDLELRRVVNKKQRPVSFAIVGDKEGGVEPGFKAVLTEDLVFYLSKLYPDRATRLERFYREYGGNLNTFYQKHKESLPEYLVKQDYALTSLGLATPDKEKLKRTATMEKAYQVNKVWGELCLTGYQLLKTGSPLTKNCDAVREALANDLARASSMSVQEQTLCKSRYDNGSLKLLLKGKWLKQAKTLAPLAGAAREGDYNYRVTKSLREPDGIVYLVNDSIVDLAVYYATLLVQGDYDAIGSSGKNKLEVNKTLFGIDFGHAYQGSSVIDSLLDSLHLPAEALKTYQNFSIFYDSKRSELMKGVLIYAKLVGEPLSEDLLTLYGEDFKTRMAAIKSGSLETIVAEYLAKFAELKEVEPQHAAAYTKIIATINATGRNVLASSNKLVNRFKRILNLPPNIHDLLDSLDKVSMGASRTSLRSADNTVLLKRVRIKEEAKRICWSAKPLVHEGKEGYLFSARIGLSITEHESLRTHFAQFEGYPINLISKADQVEFFADAATIDAFVLRFSEENIRQKFHPKDTIHYQDLASEQTLIELAASFTQANSLWRLTLTVEKDLYTLTINSEEGAGFTESLVAELSKQFYPHRQTESQFSFAFKVEDIDFVVFTLRQFKENCSALPTGNNDSTFVRAQQAVEPVTGLEGSGVVGAIKEGDRIGVDAFLLVHSVDEPVDEEGNTLLHHAIKAKQRELVHYLTQVAKADPLINNKANEHALSLVLLQPEWNYFKLILSRLNETAYAHHEAPLVLRPKEEREFLKNPERLLNAFGQRLKERADQQQGLVELVRELKDLFEDNSTSRNKRDAFLRFWRDLCSINETGIRLIHPSSLSRLQAYYTRIQPVCRLGAKIQYLETIGLALLSSSKTAQDWAFEQMETVHFLKRIAKMSNTRDITQALVEISASKTLLVRQHRKALDDVARHRELVFGSTIERRELWDKSKKASLLLQWNKLNQKAHSLEKSGHLLAGEEVFNLISSRILLSSSNSLKGDEHVDGLFMDVMQRYAFLNEGKDMKAYWQDILRGLLVLGASPVGILALFTQGQFDKPHQDKAPPSSSPDSIYVLCKFSEIILTHLQQRAKHLDSCVAKLEGQFARVIKTTNAFAAKLNEDVHSVTFESMLGVLFKEVGTTRIWRAQLFASTFQIIYLVLNDELKKPNSKELDDEAASSSRKEATESPVNAAKRQYSHWREKCYEVNPIYYGFGFSEFKALIRAVDELVRSLADLSEPREIKQILTEVAKKQAGSEEKIRQLEHKTALDQREKETFIETIEKVTARADAEAETRKQAEEKARDEARAREAETKARKLAEEKARDEARAREAETKARKLAEEKARDEAKAREAETKAKKLAEAKLDKYYTSALRKQLETNLHLLTNNSKTQEEELNKICLAVGDEHEISAEHIQNLMRKLIHTEPAFKSLLPEPSSEISSEAKVSDLGFFAQPSRFHSSAVSPTPSALSL
jgi:hypothetical protein